MIRIQQILILLMIMFIFIGSYACNSPQSADDTKLVKEINEMLDKIDINPNAFQLRFGASSNLEDYKQGILSDCRLLTENPNITLPIMFKRLDNKKLDSWSLGIYFMVFEKTKAIKSIPYIANYIGSITEDEAKYSDDILYGPGAALSAAQIITSLKLVDENRAFFNQRKEIADKLRQWYEEYKKSNAKKDK